MHLENYMSNLYENLGIHNFGFSDYSSMTNVDYRTFEKGNQIDLQPGQLVASVRNQIYQAENKSNTITKDESGAQAKINQETEDIVTEKTAAAKQDEAEASSLVYRIQIAASKVKLKDNILEKFNTDTQIREIKIDGYYKYTIGNYSNMNQANKQLSDYKQNSGNTGAFIVTY
jgi:hypothetical protein